MYVHIAVSYLFGAPKRTGHAMSHLLVVDHISGDKSDFHLANLQFLTQMQNAQKSNGDEQPPGDAEGNNWYGELYPLYTVSALPIQGPRGDAWLSFTECSKGGIIYRRFLETDRHFGVFSYFGFPSDGSLLYNFSTKNLVSGTGKIYPSIRSSEKGGRKQRMVQIHQAVAFLFGAPKITEMPMSLLLVVDHINNNKRDYRAANLRIATQSQNAHLGNGGVY